MAWLLVILLASALRLADSKSMEDMDMVELVEHFGWRVEMYIVQTDDGYLIRLFRLLDPKASAGDCRPPVLMMHGLLASVETWVLQGPDKDLAFLLAKAGLDVWIGDIRGNTPGKGHISMSSTESAFWRFSWHEMGYYDVPALIDHVLQRTKGQQVLYVGHSMGTTMFLAMGASRPEYNAKVRAAILLAPSCLFNGPYSPLLHSLGGARHVLPFISKFVPVQLLDLALSPLRKGVGNACEDSFLVRPLCLEIGSVMWGSEPALFNSSLLPLILSHSTGTNARSLTHYAQNILTGRFQKLDLGLLENLQVYGSFQPPDYDLSQVSAPVALYYGPKDEFASEKDVLELARRLPDVIKVYRVPNEEFNHIDYIWARDAYNLLYKDIIELMLKTKASGFFSC